MASKTLFVGNLPYDASEEEILLHFGAYGGYNARIIPDRGFAFVEVDEERMQEAIDEKHDSEMGGRRLTVNEARPRE